MTRDQAIKFVINFGKHKGKTLGIISYEDPDYIDWLYDNVEFDAQRDLITALSILLGREV